MKKILLAGIFIIFLLLDWAALDDITTGNESDFFLEYAILVVSLLVFGLAGFIVLKKKRVYDKNKE